MRKKLYQAIIAQLSLIQVDEQGNYYTSLTPPLGGGGATAIRHFNIWNNQIQYINQEQPFHLPAVFLQFNPIQWEQHKNGIRTANASFTLHIITRHQPDAGGSQSLTQLNFFDLLDAINANLYTLKAHFFGNITSTESDTDHNHAELIDSKETYTVQLTDRSVVPTPVTAPATPVINLH